MDVPDEGDRSALIKKQLENHFRYNKFSKKKLAQLAELTDSFTCAEICRAFDDHLTNNLHRDKKAKHFKRLVDHSGNYVYEASHRTRIGHFFRSLMNKESTFTIDEIPHDALRGKYPKFGGLEKAFSDFDVSSKMVDMTELSQFHEEEGTKGFGLS